MLVKRILDIVISAVLLIACSPLIVCVSILIRLRLGGPVIFMQKRPGLSEIPFNLIKFRTMSSEIDNSGMLLPDGERLTPLGRRLRQTSLDELPSLVNVLRGEMSLVGPRPLLLRYTEYMTDEERRRYTVRPGLTGWAQVNGRNNTPWDERLAQDVWYVDSQSLALDLRILFMTIAKVLSRTDVNPDAESLLPNLDDDRREPHQ